MLFLKKFGTVVKKCEKMYKKYAKRVHNFLFLRVHFRGRLKREVSYLNFVHKKELVRKF